MRIDFSRAPRAIFACAALSVSGCAGFETEVNSLSFHEGQAESNEQILLRNIILAAHDKTPTFVAAKQVSSVGKANASVSAAFNRLTTVGHTLTPNLFGERSQNVTILDYGATKAAQHLYADVPPDFLTELATQGWPPLLIDTLFFNAVVIHEDLEEAIHRSATRRCRNHTHVDTVRVCELLRKLERRCTPARSSRHFNNAETICDFERFQAYLLRLALAGVTFTHARTNDNKSKEAHQTIYRVSPQIGDPKVRRVYARLRKRHGNKVIEISIRSPKQVISFLGRLAAFQLYNDPPYVAKVPIAIDGGIANVAIFQVCRGLGIGEEAAVSTSVAGLGTFFVPLSSPLSVTRDQSIRVMAMAIELQNRARQEAPIQGTGIAILQ